MSLYDEQNTVRQTKKNIESFIVALLISVAMWLMVSVLDRIEAQVDINVDYVEIPKDLIVIDGLISKLTVRLKGPERLIRAIPRDNVVHTVNLSMINPERATIVPLSSEILGPAFRAFEIVDIQPSRLVVKADTLMEREVSVKPVLDSPLRGDALEIENVSVKPSSVKLRGPESIVSTIPNLPLFIRIDPKEVGTSEPKTLTLDTPNLVTALPSVVRVMYTVTSGRGTITRFWPVEIISENASNYKIAPKEIELKVQVPEALVRSISYLNKLKITVLPPAAQQPGETLKLKPRVQLPEGMVILEDEGMEISVTKIK